MSTKKRTLSAAAAATALAAPVLLGTAGAGRADVPREVTSPAVFTDAAGDVTPGKLDVRQVSVQNTATKLVVKVSFPGVAKTYDFPTGNISVFLDTDATREGAEWGHFMEFWSDYRFTPVHGWKEQRAVEGCEAQLRSDKGSKLRWFRFIVKKKAGCLTGDAVRVAVSTMNTGDLDPYVEYDHPAVDWLIGKKQWTDWVTVG